MDTRISTDQTLDCRGVSAPWPMVRLTRKMRFVPSGTEVELLVTDNDTLIDVDTWCGESGNLLTGFWRHAGLTRIFIRKL